MFLDEIEPGDIMVSNDKNTCWLYTEPDAGKKSNTYISYQNEFMIIEKQPCPDYRYCNACWLHIMLVGTPTPLIGWIIVLDYAIGSRANQSPVSSDPF